MSAVKKGYRQSPEHKEKIRQAAIKRWANYHAKKDPKKLRDTACSLCVEFSEKKDFAALRPNCRRGNDCVIRIIWTRFLLKFERKREKL